jgi:hypothetical protein
VLFSIRCLGTVVVVCRPIMVARVMAMDGTNELADRRSIGVLP